MSGAQKIGDVKEADGEMRNSNTDQVVEFRFANSQLLFGFGLASVLLSFLTAASLLEGGDRMHFYIFSAWAPVHLLAGVLMVWIARKVYVRVSERRVEILNRNLLSRSEKRPVEFGLDEVASVEKNEKAIVVKLLSGEQATLTHQALGKKDCVRLVSILKSAAGNRLG